MKKSTSSILVLCILLSVILSSFSSAETTEPSIMTKASDQVSMTFDEYLEQGSEDWFLTGKRQYAVQAMMVSQETSFHNELEVTDYTRLPWLPGKSCAALTGGRAFRTRQHAQAPQDSTLR